MSSISLVPTPYRVVCVENIASNTGCGGSYLTKKEYLRQMYNPHGTRQCPICGGMMRSGTTTTTRSVRNHESLPCRAAL